jgi:hypothetical protein
MSSEDQREFDRWLKVNAVGGSILAVGLLVMALAGANTTRHVDTAAAPIPIELPNRVDAFSEPETMASDGRAVPLWLSTEFQKGRKARAAAVRRGVRNPTQL